MILFQIKSSIYWLICIAFSYLSYKFIFKTWLYFKMNNVTFIRGWPLIGAQYKVFFGLQSISDSLQNLYDRFPREKLIGFYETLGVPAYLIRDPELIHKITIKDFDYFTNHRFTVDMSVDSMLGRSLFFIKDQHWRDRRSFMTPVFTGNKIKIMFSLMYECCDQLTDQIMTSVKQNNELIYEMRDVQSRICCDTIATCAFGLELNSLIDRQNEFYTIGQSISNLDDWKGLKFMLNATVPKIMKMLGLKVIDDKDANYLRKLVHGTIDYREKNGIIRMDMINLLMQARKGLLKSHIDDNNMNDRNFVETYNSVELNGSPSKIQHWDDDDIVAQTLIFLVGGIDTTPTVLCFAIHELAINPDVQTKLYNEIHTVENQLNGQTIDFEIIQQMSYLDMVLSEAMRKWSPISAIDRVVTKPYVLKDNDGLEIKLNIGDGIMISVPGLQMDPKYFPNPDIFDPERFNKSNKKSITPFTYMPFGLGPRNCIAMRFAILQCKVILFNLLSKFRIDKCKRTQDPLRYRTRTRNIDAEKGFWVKLVPRC